jgi:hypothetical protein
MRRLLATTAVLMVLASPAHAENNLGTAEGFLKEYAAGSPAALGYFLHGVAEGLGASNANILAGGGTPFFWPPGELGLVNDQLVDIMRRFLIKFPKAKSQPVPGVLLFALHDTFPCK